MCFVLVTRSLKALSNNFTSSDTASARTAHAFRLWSAALHKTLRSTQLDTKLHVVYAGTKENAAKEARRMAFSLVPYALIACAALLLYSVVCIYAIVWTRLIEMSC